MIKTLLFLSLSMFGCMSQSPDDDGGQSHVEPELSLEPAKPQTVCASLTDCYAFSPDAETSNRYCISICASQYSTCEIRIRPNTCPGTCEYYGRCVIGLPDVRAGNAQH